MALQGLFLILVPENRHEGDLANDFPIMQMFLLVSSTILFHSLKMLEGNRRVVLLS